MKKSRFFLFAALLLAFTGVLFISCSKKETAETSAAPEADGSAEKMEIEKVKAGFVYIGPAGDFGWTYAHEKGRQYVQEKFGDWLETITVESVPEGDAVRFIDRMVRDSRSATSFSPPASAIWMIRLPPPRNTRM